MSVVTKGGGLTAVTVGAAGSSAAFLVRPVQMLSIGLPWLLAALHIGRLGGLPTCLYGDHITV